MQVSTLVFIIAALLALVSLAEPLAARSRLPSSVILALAGLLIGTAALAMASSPEPAIRAIAVTFDDLPLNSQVFLFIFLPALLFQGALNIDARDMIGDAVPIFTLAVLAVLVATLAIGLVMWPLAGLPLIACLLVGAIVATTDPSAVIAIFRDLGAPQRLTRLVEGESLSNDAVAITLFVIFLGFLATGQEVALGEVALRFLIVPIGGGLVGHLGGRLAAALFSPRADDRLVQVSLTLALPYLVFVAAEHWHFSGPIAVVAAGLTLSALGPARASPSVWRYLQDIWEQLAFWAGSLVFILAAILMPRMMISFGFNDFLLLLALTAMALLARAAVLFVFLPLLSALRLSPPISPAYRTVVLWGGLRGAVTLALALAVTENTALPEELKRFVAVLATSFVLFTLLVQGTTLRPLLRALKLDQLTRIDAALQRQALRWAQADARETIAATGASCAMRPELATQVAGEFAADAAGEEGEQALEGILPAERTTLALAALTARESDLIRQHLEDGTASPPLIGPMLAWVRRLLDAARTDGLAGYAAEARAALGFSWRLRAANALHARLGLSGYLERALSARFERLVLLRIVLTGLRDFADQKLAALLGESVRAEAGEAVAARLEHAERELEALRLQYPEYADRLERRFLQMSALRREELGYERLYEEGLIGPEVRRALKQSVQARVRAEPHPHLDVRLSTATLISRVMLFQDLTPEQSQLVQRRMRPAFAIPGQRLIARGERGDAAWFIASGAIEVDTGRQKVRLGRGDVFGELALLTGALRTADVTAIAFCELLVLRTRDFNEVLARTPDVRARVEAIAEARLASGREMVTGYRGSEAP